MVKLSVLAIKKEWTTDATMPILSLDKNIQKYGLKLTHLANEFDHGSVVTIVTHLIDKFCENFNLTRNMTHDQAENLAVEIVMEEGHQWTIEELAVFFDRAASGRYYNRQTGAQIFDRIDKQVISAMMDEYFATDRKDAIHSVQDDKDSELKKDIQLLPRSTPPIMIKEIKTKYEGTHVSNVHIPGITSPEKNNNGTNS